MDKENNAAEGATEQVDSEARIAALEAERAKLMEERSNYKNAFLREKGRNRQPQESADDEDLDERVRRIAAETIAATRMGDIDREKDAIIARALRENRELRLAQANRTANPPTAVGAHSEGTPATDTSITADQLAYFKSRNWSDRDIERYKKTYLSKTR